MSLASTDLLVRMRGVQRGRPRPARSPRRRIPRCARPAPSCPAPDSITARFLQWMPKISSARGGRGQVDEEDLVESALAHQFRRQRGDVVRGGDDEHARALLREPREERAEHAARRAAVAIARGRAPSRSRPATRRRAPAPRPTTAIRAGSSPIRRATSNTARRNRGAPAARRARRRRRAPRGSCRSPARLTTTRPWARRAPGAMPSNAALRCRIQRRRFLSPPTSANFAVSGSNDSVPPLFRS